ncbi:DUF2897 family protein [Pseudoalteromonas sp. H105]|jgi:hypothetical protein|nr:DUF2897 family protein [Pseudoalteromonas sp. H105]
MELWHILIIVFVLAIIIGNIMLLKHSANIGFKIPPKTTNKDEESMD